ncbi:MAG: type IX secretion system membrane protein PorP/SprF [Cyclobacteriaceae bacterium]
MRALISLCLLFAASRLSAQDPAFSQYYAAPLYLNPAFAGSSPDHRLIANHRNQWPAAGRGFQTYAMSYDANVPSLRSGFGLMLMTDKAGSASLRSTVLHGIYSYKLKLGDSWVIATGLDFGYGSRSIEMNKLIFGDQLQFDTNGAPSDDPAASRLGMARYFDFGSGLLIYNKTFWMGASINHMNHPNRSMLGEEALIPVATSIHGGLRIPLYNGPFHREAIPVLSPSFVYKRQGRFEQLDVGAYLLYDPLVLGVWYRGIPFNKGTGSNITQDAVVVVLGFQFDRFEVSYSYDMTVSKLGPLAGGAHEIALKYKAPYSVKSRRKKEKLIPCPTFLGHQETTHKARKASDK